MDRYYEYTDRLNAPIEAFTHITNDHNFPILPHWHYFIECIYLTAGNLLVTCDENVYSLQPGDFIFFPPKTLHTIDVFPTDFEQSRAEKPSQDPAFTLKSQDFFTGSGTRQHSSGVNTTFSCRCIGEISLYNDCGGI